MKAKEEIPVSGPSGIWMLQAARTEQFAEFLRSVSPADPQHWWLSKFAKSVRAGDLVYFWQAGSEEALCGWGHVEREPYPNPDRSEEAASQKAAKARSSYLSNPYRLDYLVKTVFDRPITRSVIDAQDALGTRFLRKVAFAGLTKLTREEALALNGLIDQSDQPSPPINGKEGAAVSVLPDTPALVDLLRRKPFAVAIANHLMQVLEAQDAKPVGKSGSGGVGEGDAFILHLHGPWGSGKSSLLNFLHNDLKSGRLGQEWIVVWFNAWRKQRTGPAWWALSTAIFEQGMTQLAPLNPEKSKSLRWRHMGWLLYTGPLPLAVLAIGLLYFFLVGPWLPEDPGRAKTGLDILAGFGTVTSLALSAGRYLLLGSPKTASMYMQLARDPQQSIIEHFEKMVGGLDQPIAVLVDDLDRCDNKYVVELLHDIQTLFRRANLRYVVAADKQWLRSSYEAVYKDFKLRVSDPGRSLGYLFLEKIFQVSLSVPTLSPRKQREYLDELLTAGPKRKALRGEPGEDTYQAARDRLGETLDEEELAKSISKEKDLVIRDAMITEAVDRVTSAKAREKAEKFLNRYADMMEPNPRSMKRLINLFAFRQALNLIEERVISNHHVALWVIIEHRWPELADLLIAQPEFADQILTAEPSSLEIDPELRDFLLKEKNEVRRVLRGAGKHVSEKGGLSSENVQALFGLTEQSTQ